MKKEETLAASRRFHSTFVSKTIKTEEEEQKGGLAKLREKRRVRSRGTETRKRRGSRQTGEEDVE